MPPKRVGPRRGDRVTELNDERSSNWYSRTSAEKTMLEDPEARGVDFSKSRAQEQRAKNIFDRVRAKAGNVELSDAELQARVEEQRRHDRELQDRMERDLKEEDLARAENAKNIFGVKVFTNEQVQAARLQQIKDENNNKSKAREEATAVVKHILNVDQHRGKEHRPATTPPRRRTPGKSRRPKPESPNEIVHWVEESSQKQPAPAKSSPAPKQQEVLLSGLTQAVSPDKPKGPIPPSPEAPRCGTAAGMTSRMANMTLEGFTYHPPKTPMTAGPCGTPRRQFDERITVSRQKERARRQVPTLNLKDELPQADSRATTSRPVSRGEALRNQKEVVRVGARQSADVQLPLLNPPRFDEEQFTLRDGQEEHESSMRASLKQRIAELNETMSEAGSAVAETNDLASLRTELGLINTEFTKWAPKIQKELNHFQSVSRWATWSFEEGQVVSENLQTAFARLAGTKSSDDSSATASEDEAYSKPSEKHKMPWYAGYKSRPDLDGVFAQHGLKSQPNPFLLNTTLLILDTVMSSCEPFKALWPFMRDELMAAIFPDYRRQQALKGEPADSELPYVNDAQVPHHMRTTLSRNEKESKSRSTLQASRNSSRHTSRWEEERPPFNMVLQLADRKPIVERYDEVLEELSAVKGMLRLHKSAGEKLKLLTDMASWRADRQSVRQAFTLWRTLTRRTNAHRKHVTTFTSSKRQNQMVETCFLRWRRLTSGNKVTMLTSKYDDARRRLLAATKDHTHQVEQLNKRYHTDLQSLEFELFQETDNRKNLVEAHHLEELEWKEEKRLMNNSIEDLKTSLRQWRRAAMLSNPAEDSTPPPPFLLLDMQQIKNSEDELYSVAQLAITGHILPINNTGRSLPGRISSRPTSATNSEKGGVRASLGADPEMDRVFQNPFEAQEEAGAKLATAAEKTSTLALDMQYAALVNKTRTQLETLMCTWVNHELAVFRAAQGKQTGRANQNVIQIANTTTDLKDGSVYIALCRALTPPEHQRRGDTDVFSTIVSLMFLQTSHGALPPLILQCPNYKKFFSPETFGKVTQANGGLWILCSLFVARCLKTTSSSRFKSTPSLLPNALYSPSTTVCPRPPLGMMLMSGINAQSVLAAQEAAKEAQERLQEQQQNSLSRRTVVHAKAPPKHSRSRSGKRTGTPNTLTVRSLSSASLNATLASPRNRPGSRASFVSESSVDTMSSISGDDEDDWLNDDDDSVYAIPEHLKQFGPSELLAHWAQLADHSAQWVGLARVVVSLVTRFRVLDHEARDLRNASPRRHPSPGRM